MMRLWVTSGLIASGCFGRSNSQGSPATSACFRSLGRKQHQATDSDRQNQSTRGTEREPQQHRKPGVLATDAGAGERRP